MTVREEVQQRIEQDPELIRLRKKIESGKATYADTAAYSNRAGKLLGEVFSRRLPEIPLEEREPLCVELLHDRYIDINAVVDTVQRFMDDALGIHIAPQYAPFDSERGHQIGSSLRDLSKPVETLQRRAQSAPETATKAIHDDRMKTEAKFRHRAGLDCRITRVAVNGCCPWCSKVAGRYRYGEEPDDIYRRHDNCDCTVTFENGRKRQDVWSKREWEAPEPGAGAGDPIVLTKEQAAAAGASERVVLTKEQAAVLQKKYQLKQLTTESNDDIIYYRKGKTHRKISDEGRQIIDKPTYHKIVDPAIKRGADIRIADGEWLEHLNKEGARAVTVGPVIYFRPDATVSDVLEEVHHFYQNRNGLNSQYGNKQRQILNEIDAKRYLLSLTEKYHIPPDEVAETDYWLNKYLNDMEEMKRRGEW